MVESIEFINIYKISFDIFKRIIQMDDIIKAYDRVKKVILAISLNNSENLE